jgi:hypothetical protein
VVQDHQEEKIEESSFIDLISYLEVKRKAHLLNIIKTVADMFPAFHISGALPFILGKLVSTCLSGCGGLVSGSITTAQIYAALA